MSASVIRRIVRNAEGIEGSRPRGIAKRGKRSRRPLIKQREVESATKRSEIARLGRSRATTFGEDGKAKSGKKAR